MRRRPVKWRRLILAVLLIGVAAGVGYAVYPSPATNAAKLSKAAVASGLPNQGVDSYKAPPKRISVAIAKGKNKSKPASKAQPQSPRSFASQAVSDYAGTLLLSASGSQLASWNQTSSYCPSNPGWSANGTVATDSAGDVTLTTKGEPGSCAALISPKTYSSDVIEADIDFPALPGHPGTIANWDSFWMTYGPDWPSCGELDAAEIEPVDGENDVTWHSGTSSDLFGATTGDWDQVRLPTESANLTPGWHTVDIVYTKGFFAIYYDGHEFTSYTSDNVTGSALNIMLTTGVTPDNSEEQQAIGGPPVNSDTSPATVAVKYVKVWSFK